MPHFKRLLKKPLRAIPNSLTVFILVVALLGFADSSFLAVEHFLGRVPPCSITAGCEQVLTSTYATIYSIPVSLVGVVFYLLILVGVFAFLESKAIWPLKWALLLTIPGFLASLWFVYIQVFIIHSYCAYCLGSALTSTILFVAAMDIFARYQQLDYEQAL